MKQYLLSLIFVLFTFLTNAQIGIGTTSPDPSSILEVQSTTKGFLAPRINLSSVTNSSIDGANTNAAGLLIYNTNASVTGGNGAGYYYWDGSIWVSMKAPTSGGSGAGWQLDGNSVASGDFLGTTNNFPLEIRINNSLKTRITSRGQIEPLNTANSVYLGQGAGANAYATAINNIFIGYASDYDTGGASNSIILGYNSRVSSTNSIVLGTESDADNNNSVSIGRSTQSQGDYGVVIGDYAYTNRESGIAIGRSSQAQGDQSISVGRGTYTSGTGTIAIGYSANAQGTNAIAIGKNTYAASNTVRIGTAGVSSIGGPQPWSNTSDGRFKYDLEEDIPGLDFIKRLRPVSYILDKEKLSRFNGDTDLSQNSSHKDSGFIAQEVAAAAQDLNYDFSGVYIPQDLETDTYALSYATFVVPLVKAVQEQQEQIESLQKQVSELEQLKAEFAALKAMVLENTSKASGSPLSE